MSLLITVTKDLFFAPTDSKVWMRYGVPEWCRDLVQLGPDDDYMRWELSIDLEEKCIFCGLVKSGNALPETERRLPLRPGTIVLDDPTAGGDNPFYVPQVKSFRTVAFQNFLDRYGIYAMRRCNLSGIVLYDVNLTDANARTSCVYCDGGYYYDSDEKMYCGFTGGWVLERRVRFDESGNVMCAGYVLYTMLRDTKTLEKSFAEHGILPVR